jgi:transposase InsO family protein
MILGMPASTVHRVLVRYGMNRLAWMDRPSGRVIRRYEKARPGELDHVDVKKLGRIPTGGGWRAHGRGPGIARGRGRTGYGYIHAAIDDHSRLVYAEVLTDEKATTAVAFLQRAAIWLSEHGITINTVMTDNGACYRSHLWADTLQANSIRHVRTRPHRPQTNGKIERWFRTLTDECIYTRPYRSEHERTAALDHWLHTYNHHRHHTAIGGPPITRIHNPAGQHN